MTETSPKKRIKTIRRLLTGNAFGVHPAARHCFELWRGLPRTQGLLQLLSPSALQEAASLEPIDATLADDEILVIGGFSTLDRLPNTGFISIRQHIGRTDEEIERRAAIQMFAHAASLLDGRAALGAFYLALRQMPKSILREITGHGSITMEQIGLAAGVSERVVRHQVEQLGEKQGTRKSVLSTILK